MSLPDVDSIEFPLVIDGVHIDFRNSASRVHLTWRTASRYEKEEGDIELIARAGAGAERGHERRDALSRRFSDHIRSVVVGDSFLRSGSDDGSCRPGRLAELYDAGGGTEVVGQGRAAADRHVVRAA